LAEKLYPDLGRRIRELRKAVPLTQQELGNAAGVGKSYISDIEKGKQPSAQVLRALARKLGVPYSTLAVLTEYQDEPLTDEENDAIVREYAARLEVVEQTVAELRRALIARLGRKRPPPTPETQG
jgi:transcriptional regulator with XRE-family HTH domain